MGLPPQLSRFKTRLLRLTHIVATGNKPRQDGLAAFGAKGAALRNLDGVLKRLGQIAEDLGHLLRAFERVLRRHPPPVVFHDEAPLRDAQKRVVGLIVVRGGKVGLVGGNDGNVVPIGQFQQLRLHLLLALQPVALDLNV